MNTTNYLPNTTARVFTRASGIGLLLAVLPSMVFAQEKTYQRYLSHADSVAIAAASAKADTGRMILPFQDLSRYTTPGQCLALTKSIESTIWRSNERDTMKYGPSDSLPTEVRVKGAQCIAKMRPDNVAEMDLYNLLQASARVGDTARMRATIEYYRNLERIPLERRLKFIGEAAGFVSTLTRPEPFPFLASVLDILKSYGAASLTQTATVYTLAGGEAVQLFDTAAMIQNNKARLAYLLSFSDEDRKKAGLGDLRKDIYEDSLMLVTYKEDPDWRERRKRFADVIYESEPFMAKGYGEILPSYVGRQPAEMELQAIYPEGASATPVKGRVTIYFSAQTIGGTPQLSRTYGVLRRLYDRYHAKGLDIVIVTGLQGFMWYSPPLTPEQEAPLHGWYFREYHNLPFTILVNRREMPKRDDGKLVRQRTQWELFFENGTMRNRGYMVGKDGTVRAVDLGNYTGDEYVAAYIERELRK